MPGHASYEKADWLWRVFRALPSGQLQTPWGSQRGSTGPRGPPDAPNGHLTGAPMTTHGQRWRPNRPRPPSPHRPLSAVTLTCGAQSPSRRGLQKLPVILGPLDGALVRIGKGVSLALKKHRLSGANVYLPSRNTSRLNVSSHLTRPRTRTAHIIRSQNLPCEQRNTLLEDAGWSALNRARALAVTLRNFRVAPRRQKREPQLEHRPSSIRVTF